MVEEAVCPHCDKVQKIVTPTTSEVRCGRCGKRYRHQSQLPGRRYAQQMQEPKSHGVEVRKPVSCGVNCDYDDDQQGVEDPTLLHGDTSRDWQGLGNPRINGRLLNCREGKKLNDFMDLRGSLIWANLG